MSERSTVDRRALGSGGAWRREGDAIVRDLRARGLRRGDRARRTASRELAEAANHHPDILVHGWNKVRLTLSTHSEGGLTEADLALAARIDALAVADGDRRAGCYSSRRSR